MAGKDSQQADVASGRYKRATEGQLVLGGFAILLVVGGGLTTVLMGSSVAAFAVAVILLAGGLLLLLYMGLGYMERWLKR